MYNGIINVYKEAGYTSFDVVAKLRGITHQKKIGHTGTLDPEAEGVLPVCFGKATKVCGLLTDKDKEYEAVLLLGKETDTQDMTGTVLREAEVTVTPELVKKAVASFVGAYGQIPPMYSALKVQGRKLCDLARKGITVERKPRQVTIYSIEILAMELPRVRMRVHCSKGTYIRTLCQDIGAKLGCYGCMESLKRTRVSCFRIEDARTLGEIEQIIKSEAETDVLFWNVDTLFLQYPCGMVLPEGDRLAANGNRIPPELFASVEDAFYEQEYIRLYNSTHQFIGLYRWQDETGDFKPVKMFI